MTNINIADVMGVSLQASVPTVHMRNKETRKLCYRKDDRAMRAI